MIEITVKLDTAILEQCVRNAWATAFELRGYSSGVALQHVNRQVQDYILDMDLTDIIKRSADEQLRCVVDSIVADALRKRAAKLVKQMSTDGTLLKLDE